MIQERQREGIAIAKARGVYRGREVALTDALREKLKDGDKPAAT